MSGSTRCRPAAAHSTRAGSFSRPRPARCGSGRGPQRSPYAGRRRARGFTLLEVVVALAIVAIGMLAAFRAVTSTASNAAYLRDRTFASWIASDLITDLRLRRQMPSVGETEGTVDFANERWRWRSVVVQTEVSGLRQVRMSVRRASDADDVALVEMVGVLGDAQLASVPSATPWAGAGSGQGP